jgi:predicted alpha/beta superfamily hydrolase
MKKISIIFILIASSYLSYGQNYEDIIIGKTFSIKSEILNADREISVYLPNSYESNNYVNYPVLYLLDGRKFFNSFTGIITQLSNDAMPAHKFPK